MFLDAEQTKLHLRDAIIFNTLGGESASIIVDDYFEDRPLAFQVCIISASMV